MVRKKKKKKKEKKKTMLEEEEEEGEENYNGLQKGISKGLPYFDIKFKRKKVKRKKYGAKKEEDISLTPIIKF